MNPNVVIYTDGSSRGNPGPGGYGIVMIEPKSNYIKEFSCGYKKTTNNRMELMAVIVALEKIKADEYGYEYWEPKYNLGRAPIGSLLNETYESLLLKFNETPYISKVELVEN